MPNDSESTRPLDHDDRQLLGLSPGGEAEDKSSIITTVMDCFGLGIVDIHRTKVGNNNSSYIVTVSHKSMNVGRIGYVAGTYPFPPLKPDETRKVVFTTAQLKEDMDAALMSANKVAAMKLIHDAGGYASTLTPHVYGWSDGREAGIAAGKSWCLMEYMPGRIQVTKLTLGVVLSKLWDDLDDTRKLQVVKSIALIIKSLQSVPIPDSSHPYGAFSFVDPKTHSPVVVGETCFHYGGPFKHVRDLYAGQILNQWEAVVQRAPRLNKWSGSSVTLRSGKQLDLGDALQELVAIVEEDGHKWHKMTEGLETPAGFIHGDFSEHADSLEFTALLDVSTCKITLTQFEFAQSGPPIDEYFQSLPTQHMIYLGDRPSMSGTNDKPTQDLLFQGALLPLEPSATVKQAHAYISVFKEAGVFGPWSLPVDVLKRQAGLYWFGYELCNGPLQRETFWTNMDERSVKRRERMLKEVRENLEEDVRVWLD